MGRVLILWTRLFYLRCAAAPARQRATQSHSRESRHRRRSAAGGHRRRSRGRARGTAATICRCAPEWRSPMRRKRLRGSVRSRFCRTTAIRTRRLASRASRSMRHGRASIVRAEPGTIGFFGPIDIAGNRRVDDRIIRRRLAYAPGDLFRRSAIEQTQQRDRRARPVQVDRDPRARHRQPARGRAHAHHGRRRNAMEVESRCRVCRGRASRCRCAHQPSERVRLGASAIDLQGRVSRIERTAEVAFTQTDAWHPALSLSLQARHQEIDERAFFVMSRGGQAAVSWQWTKQFASTVSYAVALERSDVDASLDPLLGLEDGMLSAWSRRSRSSPRGAGQRSCARDLAARRAGRRMDAGHVQLLQRRRRRAPLSARVRRPRRLCEPRAAGIDRSRWAAKPISRCSRDFFSADRTRCADGACTS